MKVDFQKLSNKSVVPRTVEVDVVVEGDIPVKLEKCLLNRFIAKRIEGPDHGELPAGEHKLKYAVPETDVFAHPSEKDYEPEVVISFYPQPDARTKSAKFGTLRGSGEAPKSTSSTAASASGSK